MEVPALVHGTPATVVAVPAVPVLSFAIPVVSSVLDGHLGTLSLVILHHALDIVAFAALVQLHDEVNVRHACFPLPFVFQDDYLAEPVDVMHLGTQLFELLDVGFDIAVVA